SEFSQCVQVTNAPPAQGSLAFSAPTYNVNENGGQATITVTRTGGSAGAVSVQYATTLAGTATPGSDFTATSGTLNWATNDSSSKTFNVSIIDDGLDETDETVGLALTIPAGGAVLGNPTTAVLTIVDNDPQPSISINDVSQSEGNSATTNFNFTV